MPNTLPAVVLRPRRGFMRRGEEQIQVHVDNVSISGVGFFAAPSKPLIELELVTMEIAGESAQIRIRRVLPTDGTPWTYYGAQFVDPQQRIMVAVEQAAAAAELSLGS